MKTVEFYHGALSDSYEKQANVQGFTLGEKAEWIQQVGFGLVCAYIHGCITDSEYDKILKRFQKNILLKNLKPKEVKENANISDNHCNNMHHIGGTCIDKQQ